MPGEALADRDRNDRRASWPVSRRSHQDSRRTGPAGRVGQRFRLRGIVSTSFNVTFESLLPAVDLPRARRRTSDDRRLERLVFVYALFVIGVRLSTVDPSGCALGPLDAVRRRLGDHRDSPVRLNALVFASVTVYALALCIQLSVAAISFYSLAAGAD